MQGNGNPYRPIETQVVDVIPETPTIRTLRLRPVEHVGFRPGQFIQLTVPGVGEAPFTPSSHWLKLDEMEVTVMKVGRVTARIHELKPGEVVGIRGPFGHGYDLDEFRGREVLVVGGGCGFAPLRSLMYAFFDISSELKRLVFRGGCRSSRELLYREELQQWRERPDLDMELTVDVGDESWKGPVGVVTTILDDVRMDFPNARAVVCGPPVMMMHTTNKLLAMGFREEHIHLSMEKNMSCAVGKCGHCRLGTFYCCQDGPVFRYSEIKDFPGIWD
ncbi:MAG: FAD/NAD(P)-binding protein [Acidobacteriota bacterium]